MTKGSTLYIDASNILTGGGKTHLVELLNHAVPEDHGISSIVVFGHPQVLSDLEPKPWLKTVAPPHFRYGYPGRLFWTMVVQPRYKDAMWFTPGGGSAPGRYITMCQNLLPFDPLERWRYFFSITWVRLILLYWLQSSAFRRSDGVIFLTRYCFNILSKRNQRSIKRFAVIPHGINHARFSPIKRQKTSPQFNLLYVSIVNVYKHQDKVAQAVINLNKTGVPIKLTLVGPAYGPSLNKLQQIIRKETTYGHVIDYRGKVPYEQMNSIYDGNEAFICASTCETFGMIVTEAMAMGMPILCSSKSSLPETVGPDAIYFDPENVKSIEDAILKIVNNDDLRDNLSVKSQSRALEFSWEKCARDTFDFIGKIVTSNPTSECAAYSDPLATPHRKNSGS